MDRRSVLAEGFLFSYELKVFIQVYWTVLYLVEVTECQLQTAYVISESELVLSNSNKRVLLQKLNCLSVCLSVNKSAVFCENRSLISVLRSWIRAS